MQKREPKFNIPMFAALVLLLLTMISMHLTCGLYARYTANSQGSASARVAKFDVDSVFAPVANESGKYTLTVTNNSEVTVRFKVDMSFDYPMTISVNDAIAPLTELNNTYSFVNEDWVLAPNGDSTVLNVTLTPRDWTQITKDAQGNSVTQEVDFGVIVTAEQVD